MNTLIKKFFATDTQSWSLLISRVALGVVILPHGMQKALGMYGGYGISGTLGYFESLGIPVFIGFLGILAEFAGAIGVILGLGTRFMAFSIFAMMLGAMIMGGHIDNGFFMNWYAQPQGEGYEYFILVFGLALSLMVAGSGKFSVDNLISKKLK